MADSRMRIWFALFVLAVFCTGAAAGVFTGRRMERVERPGGGAPVAGVGSAGPRGKLAGGPPPEVLLERLSRDLDLDAAQRDRVRDVLRASRGRVQALQRDVRARFDDEQQALHDEIRNVLTAEQRERFDRAIEQGRRGRGGRGRGQGRR